MEQNDFEKTTTYVDRTVDLSKKTWFSGIAGNGTEEAGSWTVVNNNDVIVLTADGEPEEYIVESSGSNTLVLVLYRESLKPGPEQIRYVFTK